MYAVIKTGGKQYRVTEGEVIKFEKLDVATGDTIEFDQVLMLADGENIQIGDPVLGGKTVKAEVLDHGRHPKIRIIKFRRRKHHRKQMGHRQDYTEVRITDLGLGKPKAAKKAVAAKPVQKAEEAAPATEKAAAKPKAKAAKPKATED